MTPDDPRHGTLSGYVAGCRDECCTTAQRIYKRQLTERHRQSRPVESRAMRQPLYTAIPAPGEWTEFAACATHPTDVWFPVAQSTGRRGGPDAGYVAQVAEARRICARCPVIDDCRAYIEANPQPGIWAGMTERDRQQRRTA